MPTIFDQIVADIRKREYASANELIKEALQQKVAVALTEEKKSLSDIKKKPLSEDNPFRPSLSWQNGGFAPGRPKAADQRCQSESGLGKYCGAPAVGSVRASAYTHPFNVCSQHQAEFTKNGFTAGPVVTDERII